MEATYEDVGETDSGSRAGLKALYSDARKRAAVAAGIGAYLYTALEPVVLRSGRASARFSSSAGRAKPTRWRCLRRPSSGSETATSSG